MNLKNLHPANQDLAAEVTELRAQLREAKETIEALALGEQRNRLLFDRSPDGVFALDPNGRFLLANPACETISGYSVAELERMKFTDLCAPDQLPKVIEEFQRAWYKPSYARLETALIRKDGRRIEVWIAGERIDAGGKPALHCTARDITERTQAQMALRQSEARYQILFETMNEGFAIDEIICDALGKPCDLRYLTVNPAFERHTGLRAADVIGRTALELFPQTEPFWFERLGKVALGGEPTQFEAWFGPLGRCYQISAFQTERGRFGVLFVDITERKLAERQLFETHQRLEALMRALPVGVSFSDDPTCRQITGNPAVFAQFDVTAADNLSASAPDERAAGRQLRFFSRGQLIPDSDLPLQRAVVENREIAPMELEVHLPSGRQWFMEASGAPIRDRNGRVIGGVAVTLDITKRKRAEEALREAQAKLQAHAEDLEKIVASRTAKLREIIAELEHFSYAIVHDLRAPLRAMQGFSELIEAECSEEERPLSREYIRRIKIAASRMDQLIADSLSYSQAVHQEYTLQPVSLFPLLNGLVQTYPNLQTDKADIQIEPQLPKVLGNEGALTQCFSNLLGNAVKFAKAGTKPQVRIWAQEGKFRQVRIWIEDHGIGVPKEAQQRIFGMFQRACAEREGTGIGLAIVRKVVERMGGQVGLESEDGQGSRFWVELPLA